MVLFDWRKVPNSHPGYTSYAVRVDYMIGFVTSDPMLDIYLKQGGIRKKGAPKGKWMWEVTKIMSGNNRNSVKLIKMGYTSTLAAGKKEVEKVMKKEMK